MLRPRINPVQPRASAARVPRPSSAWAGIYLGGNQWTSRKPCTPSQPHMSVILSEVRRQPNVVERPRCCVDLTRQIYTSPTDAEARVAVNGCPVQAPLGREFTRAEMNGPHASPARPHNPHVCHLERSEAPAERSRKTPLLPRSHETDIHFHHRPPRRESP